MATRKFRIILCAHITFLLDRTGLEKPPSPAPWAPAQNPSSATPEMPWGNSRLEGLLSLQGGLCSGALGGAGRPMPSLPAQHSRCQAGRTRRCQPAKLQSFCPGFSLLSHSLPSWATGNEEGQLAASPGHCPERRQLAAITVILLGLQGALMSLPQQAGPGVTGLVTSAFSRCLFAMKDPQKKASSVPSCHRCPLVNSRAAGHVPANGQRREVPWKCLPESHIPSTVSFTRSQHLLLQRIKI